VRLWCGARGWQHLAEIPEALSPIPVQNLRLVHELTRPPETEKRGNWYCAHRQMGSGVYNWNYLRHINNATLSIPVHSTFPLYSYRCHLSCLPFATATIAHLPSLRPNTTHNSFTHPSQCHTIVHWWLLSSNTIVREYRYWKLRAFPTPKLPSKTTNHINCFDKKFK
jgi:hypothetical protein